MPPLTPVKIDRNTTLIPRQNPEPPASFQSHDAVVRSLQPALGSPSAMAGLRSYLPRTAHLDDQGVFEAIAQKVIAGQAILQVVTPSQEAKRADLMKAQTAAMADKDFAPGAHGATSHCSEATIQIAGVVGADTSPLGPKTGGFYQANEQAKNLATAAAAQGATWKPTELRFVQLLANQGKLVVAAWAAKTGHGHTVTVEPNDMNPAEDTNPTVAQVGGSTGNGTMPFRNAFGSDKRAEVKFYVYGN